MFFHWYVLPLIEMWLEAKAPRLRPELQGEDATASEDRAFSSSSSRSSNRRQMRRVNRSRHRRSIRSTSSHQHCTTVVGALGISRFPVYVRRPPRRRFDHETPAFGDGVGRPTLLAGQQLAPKKPDTLEVKILDSWPAPKPKPKLDTLAVSPADITRIGDAWCQVRREPMPIASVGSMAAWASTGGG